MLITLIELMIVYIAEKADMAAKIAPLIGKAQRQRYAFIGESFAVAWCSGHILTLYEPEQYDSAWADRSNPDILPMVPSQFKLTPVAQKKPLLHSIRTLLENATTVVHCGDAEREGQLIVDEVLSYLGWRGPTKRAWFNDQSKAGLKKSLSMLVDNQEKKGLYHAAQLMSYSDWLIGMNLSRAYQQAAKKNGYSKTLSVGRVQTPSLYLVVARDQSIRDFTSVTHYSLCAQFKHAHGTYDGTLVPPETWTAIDGRYVDPLPFKKNHINT